jgi:hypothetical protein
MLDDEDIISAKKDDEISILYDDYSHKEIGAHINDLNGFKKYLTNVKELHINTTHGNMFVELKSMEKIIETLKNEGIL